MTNGDVSWKQPSNNSFPCPLLPQDSVEHCIIGVTILSQLTNEINQVSATAFLSEVSVQFSHSYCCVLLCLCVVGGFYLYFSVGCFPFWCGECCVVGGIFFSCLFFTQSHTCVVRCCFLLAWGAALFHWHLPSSLILPCNLLRSKRRERCYTMSQGYPSRTKSRASGHHHHLH